MKNLVKVLRFKDNAARVYELPENMFVASGTVVDVEYGGKPGSFALGVTLCDSICGDKEEQVIRRVFGIRDGVGFRKVVAVYHHEVLHWDAQDDAVVVDDTGDEDYEYSDDSDDSDAQ